MKLHSGSQTENVDKGKRWWRKVTIMEWANIILALCSTLSLITVYSLSSGQNKLSRNALTRMDTSNNYTLRSIKLAEQTAKNSDESNKKLLDLNESSIALVKKNLANTERFSKADIRAYIALETTDNLKLEDIPSGTSKITITNVGKTPASHILVNIGAKQGGTGFYIGDFISSKYPNTNTFNTLGSGLIENIFVDIGQFLSRTQTDLASIKRGEKQSFVFGLITYKDIFGDNHQTRFCLKYDHSMGRFFFYGEFNDIK